MLKAEAFPKNVVGFKRIYCVLLTLLSFPLSAGWEVAWIERFDGNSVNWDNWTAQTQANYNNEIQCYTDDEISSNRNYEVSDGTLKITARKGAIDCPGLGGENRPWTSGRLNSKDKAEFLYGRVEARIRFLELKGGTWPAFWMLENRIAEQPVKGDNDNVGWPNPGAGEIDVWEWYANNGDRYITNFFNAFGCGAERRITYPGGAPDVMSYHTYAIEWDADNIKFFMDDQVVAEHDLSNCSQYEEPMFVLLNVAIGGTLGGSQDPTLETATMEVDYVAHCTKTDANEWASCNESTPLMVDDDSDGVSNTIDECPNTPPGTTVNSVGCEIQTEPQQPASEPTIPEENVISLYSDSYRSISGVNFNPNWQQATQVTEIQIDGNNTLKYENLNYQGTDFEGNKQDVSAMDFMHVDYWTHNANSLQIYLISPGPRERPYTVDVKLGDWDSLTIPLEVYENVVDLSDTFQLKVEGNGTVYLDNIYFSRAQPADSDGDGVVDAEDQCPNTPANTEVDARGCEVEQNVAPVVSISAVQGSNETTEIQTNGGTVTMTANITDDNANDSHSLVWNAPALQSFDVQGNQMSFSPAGLTQSQITISVEVSDTGSPELSGNSSVTLSVVQPAPAPEPTPEPSAPMQTGGGTLAPFWLLGLLGIGFARARRRVTPKRLKLEGHCP